MKRSIWFCN